MLLLCTYELSNYIRYQVEMVRAGSITTVVTTATTVLSCGVLAKLLAYHNNRTGLFKVSKI